MRFSRLAVWILLLSSTNALAYIPPSQYILKTWLNKHRGLKTLKIKTVVSGMEKDKLSDVHFKDTTWINLETMTIKSIATNDQDHKLFRYESRSGSVSIVAKLLLSADFQGVAHLLKEKGIPVRLEEELLKFRTEAERRASEDESLIRWNGGVVWAIGTQLYFEKDTFYPVRLIVSPHRDSTFDHDFRFEGVRFFHNFPYPRTVYLAKNGERILSGQTLDLTSDAGPTGSFEVGFTDSGQASSDTLKNLIHLYYESFR